MKEEEEAVQCIKICVNHNFVVLHLNLRVTCKPSHIKYSSLGVYSMFGKKIFSKKPYPRRKTGHAHFSLSLSLFLSLSPESILLYPPWDILSSSFASALKYCNISCTPPRKSSGPSPRIPQKPLPLQKTS